MVAGKVKMAMGFQKSPSNPKPNSSPKLPLPSPSSGKVPQKGAVFSRSFGVYFPRCSSAQVQPRPPDVTELLDLVEQLRERVSLADPTPRTQTPQRVRIDPTSSRKRDRFQGRRD
ncbi:hypothetical protein LOK49_LG09G00862 [Camellia lanceoleosa]|uniref:Uncharacterized protein n=1 Tax=Camellia lanceoleosa TaxID=1840588 RepID=A0ACC0GMZ8_9ERIC|nr:hypothetical protein LOK49_LG09G00862 [Camellia lanceoleosa]